MEDYEIGGDDFINQMKAMRKKSNSMLGGSLRSSLEEAQEFDNSRRSFPGAAETEYKSVKSTAPSYSKNIRRK